MVMVRKVRDYILSFMNGGLNRKKGMVYHPLQTVDKVPDRNVRTFLLLWL